MDFLELLSLLREVCIAPAILLVFWWLAGVSVPEREDEWTAWRRHDEGAL